MTGVTAAAPVRVIGVGTRVIAVTSQSHAARVTVTPSHAALVTVTQSPGAPVTVTQSPGAPVTGRWRWRGGVTAPEPQPLPPTAHP